MSDLTERLLKECDDRDCTNDCDETLTADIRAAINALVTAEAAIDRLREEIEVMIAGDRLRAENDRLREALTSIAEVEEFRHGSGVFDYRPALDAAIMQTIAFEALEAGASS